MKKKKNSWLWALIIIILIIGLIILIIIKLPFFLGLFNKFFIPTGIDKDSFDTMSPGDCKLEFDKNVYCEDELIFAKLTDGKNARCVVGENYNNKGWKLIFALNTSSDGTYSNSTKAGKSGSYTYAVICLDENNKLCRTNDVDIEVEVCSEDEEAYTCGWVGNQCGGTCPDTHPLCVDVWFENNVLFWENGYSACVCLNPDTEEVHPDWKPDGQYHDDSGFPEEDENGCTDTDSSQDVHLFGVCIPSSTGIAEPDYCPTSTAVTQLWCSSDGLTCMGASYPCPTGEVCVGGVCKEELEYKDNILPSEAIPGLTYGEEDMDGCVSIPTYVEMCKYYIDSNVDSAHCEGDTERMIDCSEGWNNCGGGDGEGDWYCCNFKNINQYLDNDCCGKSGCDVVCERWYQAGS